MISKKLKMTAFSLTAGFILWVGLSPRASQLVFNSILMPRCRSEHADIIKTVSASTVLISVKSGTGDLPAHLCINPESDKLIVYFAGRLSNVEKAWARAQALVATGASVLFGEYTGFGDTGGHASLRSLLQDGLALFDATATLGFAPEEIILYGESLGTAVATHVAAQRQIAGLVLQSGFSSLEAQVKDLVPPMRLYPRCLFPKPEMSSAKNLQQGHPPLLIIHGENDGVVNVKHAEKLAEAAGAQTELLVLPGAHHADL
ncbi:MAG TPA: alpha/beta hydrolase, partial [Chroococcales cyanobacterium]